MAAALFLGNPCLHPLGISEAFRAKHVWANCGMCGLLGAITVMGAKVSRLPPSLLCLCVYVCACMCVFVCFCMYICVRMFVCASVCICVCVCVYACVYVCV